MCTITVADLQQRAADPWEVADEELAHRSGPTWVDYNWFVDDHDDLNDPPWLRYTLEHSLRTPRPEEWQY